MKELKTDPVMLLIGIGNYDWGDISLGWSFVDRIVSQGYDFLDFQYQYKLKAEDAERASKFDVVVFVSATKEKLGRGFDLVPCIAANNAFYSEEGQAPAAILHLIHELYKKSPRAYVLTISGEEWEMQTYLSRQANKNLDAAVEFFEEQFLPCVLPAAV